MSEITLVGLGAMGSSIASTLLKNNFDLTVWNRSSEKMGPVIKQGAKAASSVEEAISVSPVIMICIHGYSAIQELLSAPGISAQLNGKTIIQLSTGTPTEVRSLGEWVHQQSCKYLDGSIMVYPENVGKQAGQLLFSGDKQAYETCARIVDALGGDVRYLGEVVGAAAALDLAVLSRLTVITIGVVQGALICEREDVSLEQFANMFPEGDRARSLALSIHNQNYDENISASVEVAVSCVSTIKRLTEDLQIKCELSDFLLNYYNRAITAGYGQQDTASLIEILRADSN